MIMGIIKKYYQCQLHFDLWNWNKVARSWNHEALRILPERNTTSGHFGWKGNTNCIEPLIRRGVCWLWRSLWTHWGKTALDKVLGLQPWVGSSGLVSIWRTSGGVFKPKTQHTPLEELDHSFLFKVKIHLNVQNYKTRSMLQCVYVIWISVVFFCWRLFLLQLVGADARSSHLNGGVSSHLLSVKDINLDFSIAVQHKVPDEGGTTLLSLVARLI